MKIANVDSRLALVSDDGVVDVATASDGRFGPHPMDAFRDWRAFAEWAADAPTPTTRLDDGLLGCPVPEPRQVFAIGLNYRSHAEESGMAIPEVPATFTKFPASLSGPYDDVEIIGDAVDWEVELVVVIGTPADQVEEADAWSHIAGLTVGQDISDRRLQFAAGMQFSLGKSRRGYGPMGPWIVTPDEVSDRDDLALGCRVDGETVQDARTSDLIFPVGRLVAELSAVLPLLAGDVIFTGTPAGVGMARQPPRSLQPGQLLESWIEGIGEIRNTCVASRS
jgi:2,4-didehydro-3-deoxy-L-rhamnonate hydrolase